MTSASKGRATPAWTGLASAGPLLARSFPRTFRGLTWKRFALFCLLVELLAFFNGATLFAFIGGSLNLPNFPNFPNMPTGISGLVRVFALHLVSFLPVLLAVVAFENHRPREEPLRIAGLALAVFVGQVAGMALFVSAMPILYPNGYLRWNIVDWSLSVEQWRRIVGVGIKWLGFSLTATALYYYLRRTAEIAAHVHREELGREDSRRESAEARLQVMQAQIEPHFLFNSLAIVRRLYQTDRRAGRIMLGQLTQYLTASLPSMREARSTLGRELALALAYLNVQKIRMESRLAIEVAVPASLRAAFLPPMMLNTLVENAIIHGLSPLPEGGHLRISAEEAGGRLVVKVEDDGRGLQRQWGGGVGLANIRTRLHTAYGNAARLRLRQRTARGAVAVLELPLVLSEPVVA